MTHGNSKLQEQSGRDRPFCGASPQASDDIDLLRFWESLWCAKWWAISAAIASALLAAVYALNQPHWYRVEVLVKAVDSRPASALSSQFGGLAAFAGIPADRGVAAEAIAVLTSREFVMEFIRDLDLLPVLLYEQWDIETGGWRSGDASSQPDYRDGVAFFLEEVLTVSQSRETGFVTLRVEWVNAELAAIWASSLVKRLNDRLRDAALHEAQANVEFLRHELESTSLLPLQQTIGRLLETELQKLMLARGKEEFAFQVIDPPQVPKDPARPRRALIVLVALVIGGVGGLIFGLLRQYYLTSVRAPTAVSRDGLAGRDATGSA